MPCRPVFRVTRRFFTLVFNVVMTDVCAMSRPDSASRSRISRTGRGDFSHHRILRKLKFQFRRVIQHGPLPSATSEKTETRAYFSSSLEDTDANSKMSTTNFERTRRIMTRLRDPRRF